MAEWWLFESVKILFWGLKRGCALKRGESARAGRRKNLPKTLPAYRQDFQRGKKRPRPLIGRPFFMQLKELTMANEANVEKYHEP